MPGWRGRSRVTAPEGSILNCLAPAAVNGRLQTCQRVADMILGALAQAMPERVMACSNSACTVAYFIGKRPQDGSTWVYLETIGGGSGARATKDGLDGVHVHTTNTSNLPVEALEIEYPLTLMRYELVEDSGGVGQYRGGMGLRRVYQATHDCRVRVDITRQRSQSWGLFGGGPGGARPGRSGPRRRLRRRLRRAEARPVVRHRHAGRRRLRPARPARACGGRARSRRGRDQRRDGTGGLWRVDGPFASPSYGGGGRRAGGGKPQSRSLQISDLKIQTSFVRPPPPPRKTAHLPRKTGEG